MTIEQQRPLPRERPGLVAQGLPRRCSAQGLLPLLALLKRSLSEDEVIQAAQSILRAADFATPVTDDQIRDAVREVIEKEPTPEELNQVAGRLASVGWPLESH